MTRRVVVALDESEQAQSALEYALAEFEDAEVIALHVINPLDAGFPTEAAGSLSVTMPGYSEEWYEQAKADAEELFADAREQASAAGVPFSSRLAHGRPVQAIVEFAEDEDVDHVVVGSHGRSGMSRILLGSVAEGVVRRSPVPVTVVR